MTMIYFNISQSKNMKTILAPTDFSTSSVNAVNYAADLACSIKAKLVLFHAMPFPIAVSEISVPGDFADDMLDTSQKNMEALLKDIQIRTRSSISVTTEIKIGSVDLEIENISARERPLAVVMGIHPGKSLERALMGSSIFHAMNYVRFPTLIIPENVRFREIKKIGMACDLKYGVDRLPFETIKEWLYLYKSKLEIIHITSRKGLLKAEQTAESISIQNRLNVFKPSFHFLNGENIAEGIDEFSKTEPIDLLMVFPKEHGILGLFHKKQSKSIVSHSLLPILSIHDVN